MPGLGGPHGDFGGLLVANFAHEHDIRIMAQNRPQPGAESETDLIAHLDSVRHNYGVSLAGTLLMEEPYNPRLLELFRERMVTPQRRIVAETIQEGIDRGQIRPDVNVEGVLDLLLGAFFAAVFASGRPGPDWPEVIVDALWPALAARQPLTRGPGEAPTGTCPGRRCARARNRARRTRR